jgi:hypothetical protein
MIKVVAKFFPKEKKIDRVIELARELVEKTVLEEGCIKYETVEKTSDGIVARLIEREGPTGLIVTTTQTKLHPENETRLLSLTVTDTPEHTRNIFRAIATATPQVVDLTPWLALHSLCHRPG